MVTVSVGVYALLLARSDPARPAATATLGTPPSTFSPLFTPTPSATAGLGLSSATPDPTLTPTRVPVLPVPSAEPRRLYWGAWLSGPPEASAFAPGGLVPQFEAEVDKSLALLHWGQAWRREGKYQSFPVANFDNIRNHGAIPVLDWGPWVAGAGPDQPDFRLNAVVSGVHDAYVLEWANAAKTWGHPFFLRFGWEMNGDWKYPWSEQLNANRPGDYVAAWRHVHDLFAQAGATNVTWVWCPNVTDPTTTPLAGLYPGEAYVDWVCLSGYNFYESWISFDSLFTGRGLSWLGPSYGDVLSLAPTKPVLVVTGSVEGGDGGAKKAAWITDLLSVQLPRQFTQVAGVVWFNWDGEDSRYATLPLESSAAALAAFAAAIQSDFYASAEFAHLSASPLAPLK